MLEYKGSGLHWIRHIKTHNPDYVITLWYQLYDNIFDINTDALSMSKSFDIVNNQSWLNLIPETGVDGSIQYNNISNLKKPQNTKGIPKSKSHTEKKLKFYKISTPNGIEIVILGLHKFCKQLKLNTGHMAQVAMKKENHHKGWLCEKLTQSPFC